MQRSAPRRLTQLASLEAWSKKFDGVYYGSRHGHDLENWALFEPFRILRARAEEIARDDETFLEALRTFGLRVE